MKKLKSIFAWIIKNKEWLFSGIGIAIFSLLFTAYVSNKDNTTDGNDTSSNKNNNIEINDEVNGDIYQDLIINNYNMENNDKQEIVMSEAKYLEYLQSNVDGDIVFYYYNDYDGDGSCEMFALVGEAITSTLVGIGENLYGKIWFINEEGMMEVESNEIEYWTSPYKFSVDNKIFIAFEKAYVTGSQTFIWGVRDGKPYQPNISGKVHGLKINEYDEIEVIHYSI